MIYAQLNEENICVGVSDLSGEVEADNMKPIESFDVNILGKKYNNGEWEEVEKEPEEKQNSEPTVENINEKIASLEEKIENLETITVQNAIDNYTQELIESGVL